MKKLQGTDKRISASDSSDDEPLIKKVKTPTLKKMQSSNGFSSSSESDIENYLQPFDKIDLNSSFFSPQKKSEKIFDKLEKNIFEGVTRLSDSDSDDEEMISEELHYINKKEDETAIDGPGPSTSVPKLNFQQLQEYTNKIEEAKRSVEKYKAKKESEVNKLDIINLLAAGEGITNTPSLSLSDLHSSDFESCESEREDWEEIEVKDSQIENNEKNLVSKDSIQITVDMPQAVRKKKGVDLLAALKRRLNRIRKENQVYVHKVHLLCWIAHGNYVNSVLSSTNILAMALSLLPSEQCYPSERTDLSYLEQIVQWYKKTIRLVEKPNPKNIPLDKALHLQINKKEANNKKMLAYIFVAILRSIGIQCRLVLSFQVEPLRPPASALHSLSTKAEEKKGKKTNVSVTKDTKPKNKITSVSQSETTLSEKVTKSGNSKTTKKKADDKFERQKSIKKHTSRSQPATYDVRPPKGTHLGEADKMKSISCGKPEKVSNKEKTGSGKFLSSKNQNSNEPKSEIKSGKHSSKQPESDTHSTEEKCKDSVRGKKSTSKLSTNESRKFADLKVKNNPEITISGEASKRNTCTNATRDKCSVKRKSKTIEKTGKTRTKSADSENRLNVENEGSTISRSKSCEKPDTKTKETIKIKLPTKKKSPIPQLDGNNDTHYESSDFETDEKRIPQVDGLDDGKMSKPKSRPNLHKLKATESRCPVKDHPRRLRVSHKGTEQDSSDEFSSPSPKKSLSSLKPNLRKLKNSVSVPRILEKNNNRASSFSSPLPTKPLDVRNDIIALVKGRMAEQKHIDRRKLAKNSRKRTSVPSSDSDSDYAPEPVRKKHHESDDEFFPKIKVKQRIQVRPNRKILSDSDIEGKVAKKKKIGVDVWAEVFLEIEEKWISVDLVQGQVHCVSELYARATHPVSYIVAWNNNNTLKDITARYCQNFNTVTRKLRVDSKWWVETIKIFEGAKTVRDREEDDELARQQLEKPLPTSIAEYKNHPLYVLGRHLLKFEAIYPPEPAILGYVRGEPVYSRSCVHTLHSRDIWLKHAKVVKPGEKPYKIVKARPKYDKLSNTVITDQLLEIFGPWQVEDYVPPTAENGVVPRNAFGNVELFKACMLPKKTVHLQLPGLNKLARRMNIDCAPAVVGFDFHGGWSHPTFDGFVVCEEFEDVLVAAWEVEQEEIEKREQEKIDKRVYTNWKRLIKGLLIRERLKAKYDFGEPSTGAGGKIKKSKGPRLCTKKRRICSEDSDSD